MKVSDKEILETVKTLGFTEAQVFGGEEKKEQIDVPLFCSRDKEVCEISLRIPGGVVINLETGEVSLSVQNGCNITECSQCPRPRKQPKPNTFNNSPNT